MNLCSKCKKNVAVVYITRVENGKTIHEGLCVPCAKELGVSAFDQLNQNLNMKPEELENLQNQVMDMFSQEMENFPEDEAEALGQTMQMDEEKGSPFSQFFSMFGVPKPPQDEPEGISSESKGAKKTKTQEKKPLKKKRVLDTYGTNLTNKAKEGGVDKVIGRDAEIRRVVQILNRRTKNNPVLIGEPGVGKTAIAEGLAVKIVNKEVPAKLLGSEIYALDFTAIVAGTQFRGQFESRLKSIIEEAKKLGNVILVIDELHNIVGAGDAEGAMNAANILKPALAKGEIQVIGATTLTEYRKHIEKDTALERRFQPVIVEEPSVADTIEILKGVKGYYEDYHKVKITDDVIKTAVLLSERYITDRFLPDKAIDVIDEAGSKANLYNENLVALTLRQMELSKVQAEKDIAISEDSIENYQRAADLKTKECRLLTEISELEKKCREVYITADHVAEVIESWTKIPVQKITQVETEKLLNLEQLLHQRVISQDKAVTAVARAIRRNRAGLQKKRRPSSFIFVGATGVGKTELAKALAEAMFDSEDAIIRLDMSEYMEKHTASKIIGSPPGYVGYDDAGQLTEKVRRKPYSVILLDEIEKAHPDVHNILLQILDDGRITDSHGKVVSFENTVIIMTSNAGSDWKASALGFTGDAAAAGTQKVETALKDIFRPEFLNRVDEIVAFEALDREALGGILDNMLSDLSAMLAEKGIGLLVTGEAKNYMIQKGYDPKNGARPLRRVVQRELEDLAADLLIRGKVSAGQTLEITVSEGALAAEVK